MGSRVVVAGMAAVTKRDHSLLANGAVVLGLTASLRASACADELEYAGQMKFYGPDSTGLA